VILLSSGWLFPEKQNLLSDSHGIPLVVTEINHASFPGRRHAREIVKIKVIFNQFLPGYGGLTPGIEAAKHDIVLF
jgi:hypothetical protein